MQDIGLVEKEPFDSLDGGHYIFNFEITEEAREVYEQLKKEGVYEK